MLIAISAPVVIIYVYVGIYICIYILMIYPKRNSKDQRYEALVEYKILHYKITYHFSTLITRENM